MITALIAVLVYSICAISIGTVTGIILARLEIMSPKTVFIMALFWVVVIPAMSLRFLITKKGQKELTDVLEAIF